MGIQNHAYPHIETNRKKEPLLSRHYMSDQRFDRCCHHECAGLRRCSQNNGSNHHLHRLGWQHTIVANKDPDGAGREHGKTGWGSQPVGPMGHLQNPPGWPPPGRWLGEPVWLSVCRVTHEYHECRSTFIMDEERQIVWLNQTPNQTKATSKVTGAILAAPLRARFICAVARTVAMTIFHEGLGICVQPLLGRTAPNTAGRCWCSRKNRRSSWYNPSSPVTRTDTQFQWISINFPISPLTHPINQYPHLQLIYLWFIMISQWHFVMIWSYSRFSEPAVLISAALWAIATSTVDLPPRKRPWSAGQANEKQEGYLLYHCRPGPSQQFRTIRM
jgi:hypothetical protein